MGEVYRARDARLGRTVAVKVLPSHLSASPEARQRFEREARAVSSLNHPHICVLHDVGRHEGVDFLVMEHLEGETLAVRLERGPLPVDELLRYAIQIGDALDKAHRQSVIHRDLKPGNIMLTKTGAKLLDFGLAKSTGAAPAASGLTVSPTVSRPLTAEGSIVGTFQYMAPEQLEGQEADARSDIFAFGAVLVLRRRQTQANRGGQQASGLFRVPAAGGAPLEVTRLDETRHEGTHRWPQFLPGGRKFIFLSRITAGDATNEVLAGSLDGGEPKVLFRNDSNAVYASGHLLFIRETTLMAEPFDADDLTLEGDPTPIAEQLPFDAGFSRGVFSASENGVLIYQTGEPQTGSQLIWFDRSGKQTGTLGDKAFYSDYSVSPDLERVAVSVFDLRMGPTDLWIYDVTRNLRTRFTFDPASDASPVWSPDGSQVAFASNREGDYDLYTKTFSGSADEE